MMVEALLLDFLIVIAILLLIPLGAFRGGLREVCSSAGLMLGILIANAWAPRWGDWIAGTFSTNEAGATYLAAAVTTLLVMVLVGYGASSAFNAHPGPGGRMFGAAIAALNGIVLAGFLINNVAIYLNDGDYPGVVEDGYVSRAFSSGFDIVLLVAGALVVCLTLLGMVVRERELVDEDWVMQPDTVATTPPRSRTEPKPAPAVQNVEEAPSVSEQPETGSQNVTVREIRHWETPEPTETSDPITGWQKTWPKSATGERTRPPWASESEPRRKPEAFRKVPPADKPQEPEEALRRWMASDDE